MWVVTVSILLPVIAHSLLAMMITVVVALVVASIGAYRAINIEPAQSLREV